MRSTSTIGTQNRKKPTKNSNTQNEINKTKSKLHTTTSH